MRIKVISLFPDLVEDYLQEALIAKAVTNKLIQIEFINLRHFSDNSYKSVDAHPYGGGDGMLIRPDILENCLQSFNFNKALHHLVFLSPQGKLLNSNFCKKLVYEHHHADFREIVLLCGRYAGIDQRFLDVYVETEISIGNYILSGGELAALVFIEACTRFIPGVLGNSESVFEDSLSNSNLLEAPQYTKPQKWHDLEVPEVLLSGNHKKIKEWKQHMAIEFTKKKRPDLLFDIDSGQIIAERKK
jgi:tRNA (guanine37-N1)-methyltransferase